MSNYEIKFSTYFYKSLVIAMVYWGKVFYIFSGYIDFLVKSSETLYVGEFMLFFMKNEREGVILSEEGINSSYVY